MTHKSSKHSAACGCSVCWVKHHCDALKLFPDSQSQHTPPFTVNYREHQSIGFFQRNMRRLIALSGRKA